MRAGKLPFPYRRNARAEGGIHTVHFREFTHDFPDPALLIPDRQLHLQIFRQIQSVKRPGRYLHAVHGEDEFGNCVGDRLFRKDAVLMPKLHKRLHRFLQRHQFHTDALRKRAEHCLDLLRQIARHQIFQNIRIQQVQRIGRNSKRHPVVFLSRRIGVRERKPLPGKRKEQGIIVLIKLRILSGRKVADTGNITSVMRIPVPADGIHRMNRFRKDMVEMLKQRLIVHKRTRTANPEFQHAQTADQTAAFFKPRPAESRRPGHDGFPEEHFPRFLRVRLGIMATTARMDDELTGGDTFPRMNEARPFIPADIVVYIGAELRSDLFQPFRFHLRIAASEYARRLHQSKRQHEIRRIPAFGESGTGKDQILFPAHIGKQPRLPVVRTKLTRQAAEQDFMESIIR